MLFFGKGSIVHLIMEVLLEISIGVHLRIIGHQNVCSKSNVASVIQIQVSMLFKNFVNELVMFVLVVEIPL